MAKDITKGTWFYDPEGKIVENGEHVIASMNTIYLNTLEDRVHADGRVLGASKALLKACQEVIANRMANHGIEEANIPLHFQACYDAIRLATESDPESPFIPDWSEKCRECIASNGGIPEDTLYCPPEEDCPDYPLRKESVKESSG